MSIRELQDEGSNLARAIKDHAVGVSRHEDNNTKIVEEELKVMQNASESKSGNFTMEGDDEESNVVEGQNISVLPSN